MTDDGTRAAGGPRGGGAGSGAGRRVPASTYRVQLSPRFTFEDARRLLPYLERLGVTDLYCSPCFATGPRSVHGYDISDHNRLSPILGGEESFRSLAADLSARGMGLVLDFVPNHMGVDDAAANRPWWDVLENGICSPYARYFDIDWSPVKPELHGKVLLPILGDPYGLVLERGELHLAYRDGGLELRYFERTLPINPRRAPMVLARDLPALQSRRGESDPALRELLSILTELENLPAIVETDPARVAERQREKEVARERLARLAERDPGIRDHIEAAVRDVNGTPGVPRSYDALHDLLEHQAYRLAYWRTAFHEINYRRFFDVNGLASLRMEDPEVFAETHALILHLAGEGLVTGLRIDHLDGLTDPGRYLAWLRDALARVLDRSGTDGRPGGAPLPLYVVAEKILSAGESLPGAWPLDGTTGYDFLNDVNSLFIDPAGERQLHRIYERATGVRERFEEVVTESKTQVMATTLASELNLLAHALNRISEGDRLSRDFTLNSLHDMLLEVVACLPVYRTYVTDAGPSADDVRILEHAVARARLRNPGMDRSIFDFFLDVTLGRSPGRLDPEREAARVEFVHKLQQYTGPVQAKGLEDTAFYRHAVLLSRNEVGGGPMWFGRRPAEYHEANARRLRQWPCTLNATSTHDTKRGEDARARLDVLSELPQEWARAVSRWHRINSRHRTHVDGAWAPDRRDEYFFYQTLVGAWPSDEPDVEALVVRFQDYMRKAIREAKVHTSWINENQGYERAVQDFVWRTLRDRRAARFLESFLPFQRRVARLGAVNSLAQLTLKAISPGVPDFYQGSELWDLALVDPDNRRPVDFVARERMLEDAAPSLDGRTGPEETVADLMRSWPDGRIKLYLTACAMRERRRIPEVFLAGSYEPLEARGEHAEHVVAVLRRGGRESVIAAVPRFPASLSGDGFPLGSDSWAEDTLPLPRDLRTGRVVHVVTGAGIDVSDRGGSGALLLADLFRTCPVALLRVQNA
jgi:(1->4)-alpha-D-glucan 1-alpha-D-glucosylmutase